MRRFFPDSILFWLLAILLAGILLSQGASALLHNIGRNAALARLEDRRIAEQIEAIAGFLDHSAPMLRADIARAMSSPTLGVHMSLSPPPGENEEEEDSRLDHIEDMITETLILPVRGRVIVIGPEASPEQAARNLRPILAVLPLRDEQWVEFRFLVADTSPWPAPHLVWAMIGGFALVVALCVIAVMRMVRPLDRLTRAALALGRSGQVQELPETGMGEIARAARAFNRMQKQITRLVEDRLTMIAAISHDLKTPITRLKLRAELLDDEAARAKILADLEEMEAMIGSTLAFAREENQAMPREPVDLAETLRAAIEGRSQASLDIAEDWPAETRILGDRLALKRAFVNLIENAIAYGGEARLRLEREPGKIVLRVADSGPGIPESEMERVFRPFQRLDPSRNRESGGVGLGLAIARSVILAHGGDIALRNRPEGGLEAIVTLPV